MLQESILCPQNVQFFCFTCTWYPDRTLHKFDITFSLSRTQLSSIFVRKKKLHLTFWSSIFHEMRDGEVSLIKYLLIAPGVINFAEKRKNKYLNGTMPGHRETRKKMLTRQSHAYVLFPCSTPTICFAWSSEQWHTNVFHGDFLRNHYNGARDT